MTRGNTFDALLERRQLLLDELASLEGSTSPPPLGAPSLATRAPSPSPTDGAAAACPAPPAVAARRAPASARTSVPHARASSASARRSSTLLPPPPPPPLSHAPASACGQAASPTAAASSGDVASGGARVAWPPNIEGPTSQLRHAPAFTTRTVPGAPLEPRAARSARGARLALRSWLGARAVRTARALGAWRALARHMPRAPSAPRGGVPLGDAHRLADARSRLGVTALASAAVRAADEERGAALLKSEQLERQLARVRKQLELETSRRRALGHAAGRRLSAGADADAALVASALEAASPGPSAGAGGSSSPARAPGRDGAPAPSTPRGAPVRDAAVAGARRLAVHFILMRDELWAHEHGAHGEVERAHAVARASTARALALGARATLWRARARRAIGHSARAQSTLASEFRQAVALLRAHGERQRWQLAAARDEAARASPAQALLRAERAERRAEVAERALARAHGELAARASPAALPSPSGGTDGAHVAPAAVAPARRRAVLRSLPRALWVWRAAAIALALRETHAQLEAVTTKQAAAARARVHGARPHAAPQGHAAVSSTSPRTAAAAARALWLPGSGGANASGGAGREACRAAVADGRNAARRAARPPSAARSPAAGDAPAGSVPALPPLPDDASEEMRRLWKVQQRLSAQLGALLATAADASAQVASASVRMAAASVVTSKTGTPPSTATTSPSRSMRGPHGGGAFVAPPFALPVPGEYEVH
ncbi:hypothetical protein KFE25_010279 [Diacronema lutheri]|uniref:Uncharacterized protein n=1 Tax=Diacronema lutheri TaxID=2081491 RepID=A0A8J5XKW5_DIALT|nr:hypothetical protein KFE25_010279 [Diacronema lutheri]